MRPSVSCSSPVPTQACMPVGMTHREASLMSQQQPKQPENRGPARVGSFLRHFLIAATILVMHMTVYAREPGRMWVGALPECEVYDANPKFIDPMLAECLARPYRSHIYVRHIRGDEQEIHRATLSDALFSYKFQERIGAVADGESRLLLKKEVSGPGRVSWRTIGAKNLEHGICEPLFDGMAVLHRGKHYAFALYTPPEVFGTSTPVESTPLRAMGIRVPNPSGERPIKVEITWENRHILDAPYTHEKELVLARPPVVLVHGTYDNGHDCWEYGKTRLDGREDKYYTKAPGAYQTKNLKEQLKDLGFSVYVVNYEYSSGKDIKYIEDEYNNELEDRTHPLSSYFRDNAKVVWDGSQPREPRRGKGIKVALQELRTNDIAATKADVVGHSMGGVLARVYAEGRKLNQTDHQAGENWYRRPDNFQAGDINRLITIGSTHMGSHISGFLQHYSYYSETNPPVGVVKTPPIPVLAATLRSTDFWSLSSASGWVYWGLGNMFSGKFPRGAFTDQIPDSKALMGLSGSSSIPAHAIACVATVADLDMFKGIVGKKGEYRTQMELIWKYTPGWFLCEILRNRLKQPVDADSLQEILREIDELKKVIVKTEREIVDIENALDEIPDRYTGQIQDGENILESVREREVNYLSEQKKLLSNLIPRFRKDLELQEEKGMLRLIAAIFGNDYSDFTVSLTSQLGGLKKPYVTIVPKDYRTVTNGVLHSYEPRHKEVQAHVIELLLGGMEPFCPEGFPTLRSLHREVRPEEWPPRLPRYYAPDDQNAFRPDKDLP